ncbi:MAG: Gldg family protein [Oscillospiraceae bacterium]
MSNNTPENEKLEAAAENTAGTNAAAKPEKSGKAFNKRNFRHGTAAILLTVIFVAALVFVNVIVGVLSERFDTSADLSVSRMYTIGEETEQFIKDVDHDITITVLNSESDFEAQGTPYKQVNEILKKMSKANPRISIDYLVLNRSPNFSAKFTGEKLEDNYIVVECEELDRYRIITSDEYITVDSNEYYNAYYAAMYAGSGAAPNIMDYAYSNIEQEAVSAIMYTANDDPVRIAFTTGYGELDSSALSSLLEKNGYFIETINLTQVDSIDTGIDFVVVFAPTMDIANDDLTKLDKFLDNSGAFGKNVVYFASAQQPETPNIEAFLNEWGMSVGYSVIGQSDANYLMSSNTGLFAHYQQIADTKYAGSTYGNSLYVYGADLRPVIQIWEGGTRGNIEQEILMTTYDNAFLYPLDMNGDKEFDLSSAESGVFNDAVVAYKVHSTTQQVSRLAVFGSDMLAYNYFMEYSNSNNGTFMVNMFNHICGREKGVTITPKSFATTGFDMTKKTANVYAVVLCIVIPVAVIVLGIVIWVRRRHR